MVGGNVQLLYILHNNLLLTSLLNFLAFWALLLLGGQKEVHLV